MAGGGALTVLLFFLRLEMVPDDTRLFVLSYLLCTLPALFIGFLIWEPGAAAAWIFWAPAALYFPVMALFTQTWLRGLYQPRRHLSLIALAIAPAWPCFGSRAAKPLPALAVSALLWPTCVFRLSRRYRSTGERLPQVFRYPQAGPANSQFLEIWPFCRHGFMRF